MKPTEKLSFSPEFIAKDFGFVYLFAISFFLRAAIGQASVDSSQSTENQADGSAEYKECGGLLWLHHTSLVTWQSAQGECSRSGGFLATVRDDTQRDCVRTIVPSESGSPLPWVGLTDAKDEGVWRWVSDHKIEASNSSSWLKLHNQPDGHGKAQEQDCVYCDVFSGLLGDKTCAANMSFICQKRIPSRMDNNQNTIAATIQSAATSFFTTAQNVSLSTTEAADITVVMATSATTSSSAGLSLAVVAAIAGIVSLLLLLPLLFFLRKRQRDQASRALKRRAVQRNRLTNSDSQSTKLNNLSYDEAQTSKMCHMPLRESCTSSRKFSSSSASDSYDKLVRESDLSVFELSSSSLFSNDFLSPYKPPAQTEKGVYQQLAGLPYKHIARKNIVCGSQLGTGKFGIVWSGALAHPGQSAKPVAVKTLKEDSGKKDCVAFLQEAAIMGQFQHKNVVRLFGVVRGEPVMLVLELMKADLQSHLRSLSESPAERDTLLMASDIAQGMAYLASRRFVHRDLAARNILVDDKTTCKIGDFGMARDLANEKCYKAHGGKVSIRWTAVEGLTNNHFSTASDVWSYAVVLFEIYELGKRPYAFWPNERVIVEVQNGYRLPKPANCPEDVYRLMQFCWHHEKSQRPTFKNICQQLKCKIDVGLTFATFNRSGC